MHFTFENFTEKNIDEVISLIEKATHESYLFEKKDMTEFAPILQEEMEMQRERLLENLKNLADPILLAKKDGKIIGTIGLHPIGEAVISGLKLWGWPTTTKDIVEVVMLYVDPEYQKSGVGTALFSEIMSVLKSSPYQYFALSSGFEKGIAFWTKTLGKADVILKKYYEGKDDCYVWVREIKLQ